MEVFTLNEAASHCERSSAEILDRLADGEFIAVRTSIGTDVIPVAGLRTVDRRLCEHA